MNLLYIALSALLLSAHVKDSYANPPTRQQVRHQWNVLQFSFPSKAARQSARNSGSLVPTNAMLIDVQPYYKNGQLLKTFVTIPRFQDGIPFSLARISKKKDRPLLRAYPNYEMHKHNNGSNCDAIMSAFHVAIDECNQMWVIDDGSNGSGPTCPPKLLLFDLNTDKLVHRYHFETPLYTPGASSLFNLVLNVKDTANKCKNTMVYVADVNHHGLVVYDYNQNRAWRVENMFMYPDPNHGRQTLAGDSFVLMDGIFGLATDKKNLYFHPFASVSEYSVPLHVLDNSTLFENNSGNMLEEFKLLGERQSACPASAMDINSNLYCVTLNPISLIKWNVDTPYDSSHIKKIPVRPKELEFIGAMKVAKNTEGREELWMVSSRYQKMATGTRNFNETNFRVVTYTLRN